MKISVIKGMFFDPSLALSGCFLCCISAVFFSDRWLLIMVLVVTFAGVILTRIRSVFCRCTGAVLCLYLLYCCRGYILWWISQY